MPTLNDLIGISTSSGASNTYFVDNYVIVEPLDGPTSVEDVYDRFPAEVYQQSRDTHLFALLTALCGDAGAGLAKKQSYVARLKYEASFVNFVVLDQIYDAQFRLHRLASETYAGINPDGANTEDIWDLAKKADNDYFQRVQEFWTGTRSGNSPTGIETVARAGSGLDLEIVEHYKYIYDNYSDDPLFLDPDGISVSPEEFVIIPRYDPAGTYHYTPQVLPTWVFDPPTIADAPINDRPRLVASTVHNYFSFVATTPNKIHRTSGSFITEGFQDGCTITVSGAFNADNNKTFTVQTVTALDLTLISGDTIVAEAAGNTITIDGRDIPPANYSGRVTKLADDDIELKTSPVFPQGIPVLNPDIERNTLDLLDRIRPVDTFCTFRLEELTFTSLNVPNPTASSTFKALIRYVSGNPRVTWPPVNTDTNTFIESEVEKPTGSFANSLNAIPMTFYTISKAAIHGYSNPALQDPLYGTSDFFIPADDGIAPADAYKSEHNGPFFEPLTQIYPNLAGHNEQSAFPASQALAINNTPLVLRGTST